MGAVISRKKELFINALSHGVHQCRYFCHPWHYCQSILLPGAEEPANRPTGRHDFADSDFVTRRVAPRDPPNEGKQTPVTGHPVFVAQHATATCCRGCLAKWHKIPAGKKLTTAQINYVTEVLLRWLGEQLVAAKPS